MELNEHGLKIWKHKTNKRLFLEQPYGWKDVLYLIDETVDRQIVDSYKASTYNFSAWEPMTKDEFDSVGYSYKDIYK